MKKGILLLCFFLIGGITIAQNILEVKDISKSNDVYSSEKDEAAIIIRCHESIPLTFSSTMDKSVDVFRKELQGTDSLYYITFPTGKRYRGRELTISSRGFYSVNLELELQPKQLLTFQVVDPNALVDAGCYREHRNKGIEEIKKSNYNEARNQFIVARECSDCNKTENEENIALVDSLIILRQKGDDAFKLLDYVNAREYYLKVLSLNSYDTYASNRSAICIQNFTEECVSLFAKAESYFGEKEFEKAKELYEKIVEKECRNAPLAIERLNSISTNMRAKKDHARVLSYEYRKDVPFGFSYGKYNMHKAGGFFQMDFNGTTFDAARSDCKYGDVKFPELNLSFGWTVKIASPVWIHFGPGFTVKMYYGKYMKKKFPKVGYGQDEWKLLDQTKMGDEVILKTAENREEPPEQYEDGWTKANLASAISPVIGVTVKYSFFALRFTYQYRWTLEKQLNDFVGAHRLSAGIGIAF